MYSGLFAVLCVAALGPALALAEDAPAVANARNSYRVEVIIFRQVQPPTSSEDYNAPAGNRGFGDKRDVSTGLPSVIRVLPDSELQMHGIATQMATSSGVKVLAHAGWIQSATNWGRHAGLPLDQFGINVPDLKGKFYLERGDLLHFGAYLELGSSPTYTLSELRKVRYNEKHYLDHPAFGVIVQVSPTR